MTINTYAIYDIDNEQFGSIITNNSDIDAMRSSYHLLKTDFKASFKFLKIGTYDTTTGKHKNIDHVDLTARWHNLTNARTVQ